MSRTLLRTTDVTQRFGGLTAIDHVNIELVDLNRMYNGPIDMKAGCKNLERLPATPQMHRWLAEAYAGIRHFDAETCFKLIQAYRSTQPGKIDDKY